MKMPKLYLIVRSDLTFGQQAVQAAHALQEFNIQFPCETHAWFQESNTIALLTSSNEASLGVIVKKAQERGIPVACFYEPDRDNELTAITLGPEGKALARNLPLAFQCHSSSCSSQRSSSP